MPRKPTGRPRGRQLGSGKLGLGTQDEQDRVTLRLPKDLSTRLEAFAAGRHFHRGTPKLAACIRDAIDHYLSCPTKGQTSNVPLNGRQTSNVLALVPDVVPVPRVPAPASLVTSSADDAPQAAVKADSGMPPFDTTKYMLGLLCKRGHDYQGTGQSLQQLGVGICKECKAENQRKHRQARKQTKRP